MTDDRRFPPEANFPPGYVPPRVWVWDRDPNLPFGDNNRPTAGARHDSTLPVGRHPLQLYSMGSHNGVKVGVMLEELLAAGHAGAEYDAWMINIMKHDQFGSGFVAINPNSKIPALVDHAPKGGGDPVTVFESGSVLLYLAEKFGAFLPDDLAGRTRTINWLFWQVGTAPFLGGAFGHFYKYTPAKIKYALDRYAMEVKRQLDVLNRHLAANEWMAGDRYTIADMAIWPWHGWMVAREIYEDSGDFLAVDDYPHVQRWQAAIAARPAVRRGRMVNRPWGDLSSQLHERHAASDFDTMTEDKRQARAAGL